jgi:hypothetical protein
MWGNYEGNQPLGKPRIDGRMILKWLLMELVGRAWNGLIRLRLGISGGEL